MNLAGGEIDSHGGAYFDDRLYGLVECPILPRLARPSPAFETSLGGEIHVLDRL